MDSELMSFTLSRVFRKRYINVKLTSPPCVWGDHNLGSCASARGIVYRLRDNCMSIVKGYDYIEAYALSWSLGSLSARPANVTN